MSSMLLLLLIVRRPTPLHVSGARCCCLQPLQFESQFVSLPSLHRSSVSVAMASTHSGLGPFGSFEGEGLDSSADRQGNLSQPPNPKRVCTAAESFDKDQFLLISIGSQEDERRMNTDPLPPPHTVLRGITDANEAPDVMAGLPRKRYSDETYNKTVCCFASHLAAWRQAGSQSIVVLESDAGLLRPDILESFLKTRCTFPVWLGGVLRTPGTWDKEKTEWVTELQVERKLCSYKEGVNQIEGHKFTNSVAYYLPSGYAKRLVEEVENRCPLKTVDVWLTSHIRHLLWPNPIVTKPGQTQCGSPLADSEADLYMSRSMRSHIPGLEIGASIEEFKQLLPTPSDKDTVALSPLGSALAAGASSSGFLQLHLQRRVASLPCQRTSRHSANSLSKPKRTSKSTRKRSNT